ncbi:MAG: hypothetical protein ACRDGG_04480 [Anaerolineae bacterium]
MNPFVLAGAALLIGVLVGYVIVTRREIANLPPLEKQPSSEASKKKK